MQGISKSWPFFEEDEIQAAVDVLRSGKINYWTGEEGRLFEREFAEYCKCKYAVALANGTVALELALAAVGVGQGNEVIVPSRTFVATASAVAKCGAVPVVADVDPTSQNITADTIGPLISPNTKAIVAVHLAGWSCDMESIVELARKHDLKVVEDCAQALGARYKGGMAGSLGDVAAFSFCQDKIMTTGGEGGMLTTNDSEVWEYAWEYKDHGKNHKKIIQNSPEFGFRWLHDSFGSNLRLTEMQSAIGRIALKKVGAWVKKRRENASLLHNVFSRTTVAFAPIPPSEIYHAYYKFYAFVESDNFKDGWHRDRVMSALNDRGVPCYYGSCSEIYLEKAFHKLNIAPRERLPNARKLGETSLMFLVDPTITQETIERNAAIIHNVLKEGRKKKI